MNQNYNTPVLIINENLLDDSDMSSGIIEQFKAAYPNTKELFNFFMSGAAIIGKSVSQNGNISYTANAYHIGSFIIQGDSTVVTIDYYDMEGESAAAVIVYGEGGGEPG